MFDFTEKQINDCIKRCRNKKGWLNTKYVRSGNMTSLETRQLMKIIVIRELAFSNQVAFQDERYQICFELDKKDIMIEDLDRFDDLVLIHPALTDIPSKSLLSNETTLFELKHWNVLKCEWLEIYEAFCKYQNGQSIENFQYFHPIYAIPITTSDERYLKDQKQHILIKIYVFIKMYKAIKIGWKEIGSIYAEDTHNTLFIKIISEHYRERFIRRTNLVKLQEKQIIHSNKTVMLKKFPGIMKEHLERLSNDKSLDNADREFYKFTLENYNREPHSQGLEKAFAVLKKVALKDSQVLQSMQDFYEALPIVGKFSKQSGNKPLDNFFNSIECDGIGNFSPNYDLMSNDVPMLDRVLHQIREVLRASSDPRVIAAVSDWVEAESKILDFDVRISRRNAQKSKKDVDR
ncbi:hypothetical protein [Chamaesiphon sp.]|uniref:hypothetical protein n=1 Tax=Chamaesiphon sp. TaxID=2814140 RepID=UPI0035934DB0